MNSRDVNSAVFTGLRDWTALAGAYTDTYHDRAKRGVLGVYNVMWDCSPSGEVMSATQSPLSQRVSHKEHADAGVAIDLMGQS